MLVKQSSSFSRKHLILFLQISISQTVRLTQKPGRLQNLAIDAGMCVHCTRHNVPDTSDLMQHVQACACKHITKRRSCWSMEKAVVCMRESKGTSLGTSAKLKPALIRANTLHNQLFSEPPTVYRGKLVVSRYFHRSHLKSK